MSSSESILDEIEFTWKIGQFSKHCRYSGDAIQSPLLSVGNPRHSIWMLKLYPHGLLETHIVTTELVRLEGSMKGKVISKTSLVTSDGNLLESSVNTSVRSFLFKPLMSQDSLEQERDFYLPNDTMTLQCKLTMFGDPPDCVSDMELSENVGLLLESGHCSDLVLCTRDKEFLVHRIILARRAPKFFIELGLSDDPKVQRVEVSGISTPVLERLLSYLYRGNISPLFRNTNFLGLNLIEVGERFNLVELTGDVFLPSSPMNIYTHINNFGQTINWVMEMKQGVDGFSRTINFGPLKVSFKFQLHKVSTDNDRCCKNFIVDVNFECLPTMDKDIHLICQIIIGDSEKEVSLGGEQELSFSKASFKQYMPKYNCSLKGEDLTLKLFLKISDGKEIHYVEGGGSSAPEVPSFFGMSLLRHNLTSLFEENQTQNGGDVTLVCNNQNIRADRAILSARSPVFNAMFDHNMTERNGDKVDILDMDCATALRLVRFMYSGIVLKQSFEEDAKLYVAADKYEVTSLFRKCSGFMISDLILNNVCDILTMAFMHNDEYLMATVEGYVHINLQAIMEMDKWKSFCSTNTHLSELIKLRFGIP